VKKGKKKTQGKANTCSHRKWMRFAKRAITRLGDEVRIRKRASESMYEIGGLDKRAAKRDYLK